jgi:hypothetical protein
MLPGKGKKSTRVTGTVDILRAGDSKVAASEIPLDQGCGGVEKGGAGEKPEGDRVYEETAYARSRDG